MERICIAVCCLLAVLTVAARSDQKKLDDSLSIRIVPTSFREKGGRSITLWQPSQHFHVIITNTAEEPIRLWREWCSWGEQMLSRDAVHGLVRAHAWHGMPEPVLRARTVLVRCRGGRLAAPG